MTHLFDAKGITSRAEEYMKQYPVENIISVTAEKTGIPTDVTFRFSDGSIVIVKNGYNISYRGYGPTALYKILVKSGFSELAVARIFEPNISFLYFIKS